MVIINHLLIPEIVSGRIAVIAGDSKITGGDSKKVKSAHDNQAEEANIDK